MRAKFLFFSFFPHFLLLFTYSCLHFPNTTPPTPATPTSHPECYPSLAMSMCPLHMFLTTLPSFPPIILSHLPSGYCQFVLNFNVSGYIFLGCLFCWLGSIYSWDHMVFVFRHLALRAKFLAFRKRSYKWTENARINSAELDCNLKYHFKLVERDWYRNR